MADDFFGCDIDLDDLDEVLKFDEEQDEGHGEAMCQVNTVMSRCVCLRQTSHRIFGHMHLLYSYCQAGQAEAVAEAGVSRQTAMAIASRLDVLEGATGSLRQLSVFWFLGPRGHIGHALTGFVMLSQAGFSDRSRGSGAGGRACKLEATRWTILESPVRNSAVDARRKTSKACRPPSRSFRLL